MTPGLISIHIPKTAGRSFLNILRQVYPDGQVAHFDQKNYQGLDRRNATTEFIKGLTSGQNVLHGHFMFNDIATFRDTNDLPVVAWLRDPVDRVISNYSFFRKRIDMMPGDPELQKRSDESIMEYAKLEESRNRMSKFLDGIDLDQLRFAGITEHFDEDVIALGKMLNWKEFNIPTENINTAYRSSLPEISAEQSEEIRELNEIDAELYESAIELRQKRMN